MLVLRKLETTWGGTLILSETVLSNLRQDLHDRYWSSELGKDGQAIVIEFGEGGQPVDIVPSVFAGLRRGVAIYLMPDGERGWIQTSPYNHNRYIDSADHRSGGKLKSIAKMFKYWRWSRSPQVPLNSFHVELLLAVEDVCAGVKTYGHCLAQLFRVLSNRQCRALQDPLAISGWIKASNTELQRERSQASVTDSSLHAARALDAEYVGDTIEALRQWDIVFNGFFPKT